MSKPNARSSRSTESLFNLSKLPTCCSEDCEVDVAFCAANEIVALLLVTGPQPRFTNVMTGSYPLGLLFNRIHSGRLPCTPRNGCKSDRLSATSSRRDLTNRPGVPLPETATLRM